MKPDIDTLSLDELLNLQKQVKENLEKQKDNVIQEILEKMEVMGISLADLQEVHKPPKIQAKPKYRNPDNFSETWSGRGKPPTWMKTRLDAGDAKEIFLIE